VISTLAAKLFWVCVRADHTNVRAQLRETKFLAPIRYEREVTAKSVSPGEREGCKKDSSGDYPGDLPKDSKRKRRFPGAVADDLQALVLTLSRRVFVAKRK